MPTLERARLAAALDAIPSLDDDRICRAFQTLIEATVRTNYYRDRRAVAVQARSLARSPTCRCPGRATRSGCAARGSRASTCAAAPIARGGLRWSDRREDFRTEVLGLMKAQMVKNAVIVPTGRQGRVRRQAAAGGPRGDARRGRRVLPGVHPRRCSTSPTTSSGPDGPTVVHPPDTVVHDDDDPYLVVAADKGTATFSDIANEISLEYGFWLGDAFASGGSTGYDHKAMGITARGAWESVRRHASVLGKDADTDPLTAVGIGDMSGDVFGNGMLRSRALRLVAAFDHRHVFIDPDPDPELAFAERRRLFDLPRSSWADYDPTLISPGGGVYPRTPEVDRAQPAGQRRARRPERPAHPERARVGRAAGAGRPAVERRHRHLREVEHRDATPTSATAPTTGCG